MTGGFEDFPLRAQITDCPRPYPLKRDKRKVNHLLRIVFIQMYNHCIRTLYRCCNPLQRPNCFCMSDTISLPFVLVLVSGLLLRYLESLSEVLFLSEILDMHLLCSSRYDL